MKHLVLHNFRDNSSFIKELDYVIEEEGKLVAHIMYSNDYVVTPEGKAIHIIIFESISVMSECEESGYVSKSTEFTMKKATELVTELLLLREMLIIIIVLVL